MAPRLHHIALFVEDMPRALALFQGLLGLNVAWHLEKVGGKKMADFAGIPDMEAEMAYLENGSGTGVELVKLSSPTIDNNLNNHELMGKTAVSFSVKGIESIHEAIVKAGYAPFTDVMSIRTPEGDAIRAFCFNTHEGFTVELIEEVGEER
jgi:catechol 2,3-dioxygenase-like lactoylglutathione lyase family enzyme